MSKPERIQKILARSGHGSRRQIEQWIREERLQVNGRVARLGDCINPADTVLLAGKKLRLSAAEQVPCRVLLYHKPVGEICSRSDPEHRPTIYQRIPPARVGRWIAVGRLDINTSGLLLMTTDGELANRLMHPAAGIEREYAVRVRGEVTRDIVQRLKQGVDLEDGRAAFDDIRAGGGMGTNQWYHVVLKEGRKREVRRLWEALGLQVSRLVRVRFGSLLLPREVRPGHWVALDDAAVRTLRESVDLTADAVSSPLSPVSLHHRRRAAGHGKRITPGKGRRRR